MIDGNGRGVAGFDNSHFPRLSIFAVRNYVIAFRGWFTLSTLWLTIRISSTSPSDSSSELDMSELLV